ncbi:MAG: YihA family ribosome biogenesis GTP-binding protein [Actinobacteria bacterium]|nr:YihA family ribosome biogenesis GTP-binding protein [Actinomycetota bacterium]
MKIKKASFVTSITGNQNFPGCGLPQIAIVGKSNVGKSSLINGLVNQKKLAKTSQQPGKTRLINVFLINDNFHLIDVPGYGYAEVSKDMQEDWRRMINEFLNGSEHLKHILLLIDIRHEPGANDKEMLAWIRETGIPCSIIATKADKLSKSQQQKAIAIICRSLDIKQNEILPVSSVSKQGTNELLDHIGRILKK